MNQTQRKFLIDKIKAQAEAEIKALDKTLQEPPSPSNYIFKALLTDTLDIRTREHILSVLKDKALKAKEGANFLTGQRMGWDKETHISLRIEDLIIVPEDLKAEQQRIRAINNEIEAKISALRTYCNTVEVRVQLASDSKLQAFISDVDDLGEFKLLDSNIKLLGN